MIKIFFELNGKEAKPDDFGNSFEKAVLEHIEDSIKKLAGSLSCQNHGEFASVMVKGTNIEELTFETDGCCRELVYRVREKLGLDTADEAMDSQSQASIVK